MWYLQEPTRFRHENNEIESLKERSTWLTKTTTRLIPGLLFCVDFDLVVNGETLPFTLKFPTFFPNTPPSVIPRDARLHSSHQYGNGGELCLEFRSDNWDPSVTGAMMIESAFNLLSQENPAIGARAPVPSAHHATLGQQLRSKKFRFLLTSGLREYLSNMPSGACHECHLIDIAGPNKTWTAYVARIGPDSLPQWREDSIPTPVDDGQAALLIRVAALDEIRIVDQGSFESLIAMHAPAGFSALNGSAKAIMAIVGDSQSARLYWFWRESGNGQVSSYDTIDLTAETGRRLPVAYSSLAGKRIGLVGAGSLGSKIATSAARAGVGAFTIVDDDVLKPGNFTRHDLDVSCLGAHKVDGLASRLRAVAPGVSVNVHRIALGGQESSSQTASVLEALAECDILIDGSADPQAFNFVAAVARNSSRPMVWAEVYAGGIGGFVGRVRPGIEPPPHAARRQYLAWCREQGVPWRGDDLDYNSFLGEAPPLVADDADVGVIAAHTTRIAIDTLLYPVDSRFPHSAYAIGLTREWIFSAPFETYPIDFTPEGDWSTQAAEGDSAANIAFLVSVLERSLNESRIGV